MSFTIHDLPDLKRLLIEHPEWRVELRELILTEELVALPRVFADTRVEDEARFDRIERALEQLAQAQTRTEARVEELAQAQARTEARVEELVQAQARTEARVEELAQAQARTEARVEELAQAQARTEATLQRLIERVDKIADKQGQMLGKMLEWEYANRAPTYFGNFLRGLRVVIPGQLDGKTEEILYERLSPTQRYHVLRLDILARGKLTDKSRAIADEIWLAVEVSSVIDRRDIERAQERTADLRSAGLRVVPVVAGEDITRGASDILKQEPVLLVMDGKSEGWERALDAALHA